MADEGNELDFALSLRKVFAKWVKYCMASSSARSFAFASCLIFTSFCLIL